MIDFSVKGRGFRPVNLDWWKQTQDQWSKTLLRDNKKYWQKEENPTTGQPWAALSPRYRAWKQEKTGGKPILQLTGRMQNTAKIVPEGSGFRVQTTKYGRYHQFGTDRLVARPWMGLPKESLSNLTSLAWKNILR